MGRGAEGERGERERRGGGRSVERGSRCGMVVEAVAAGEIPRNRNAMASSRLLRKRTEAELSQHTALWSPALTNMQFDRT